jgi:hypothetical protein
MKTTATMSPRALPSASTRWTSSRPRGPAWRRRSGPERGGPAPPLHDLRQIECHGLSPTPQASWPLIGGTAWNTASGGQVTQAIPRGSTLTVRISGNVGGPLTLLGQYNPGTETCGANCAGTPAGTARPLNGQVFIQYSGFWGDPSLTGGVGFPPRGPVFQGYNFGNGYTSWYNQASSSAWRRTP